MTDEQYLMLLSLELSNQRFMLEILKELKCPNYKGWISVYKDNQSKLMKIFTEAKERERTNG